MEELIKIFASQLSPETFAAVEKEVGIDRETAETATSTAVPEMVQGMLKHFGGSGSALGTLGSLAQNLPLDKILQGAARGQGGVGDASLIDIGTDLLGNLLGNERDTVEARVEEKTSLGRGQVAQLLAVLAPFLLDAFQKGSKDPGGALGGLLDRDGDGQVLDDVAEIGGSILSGLFKKK